MANTFTGIVKATADPERRGDKLVTLNAMDKPYSKNDDAEPLFLDLKFFGRMGDTVESYVQKGRQIFISGELRARKYKEKTYYSVNCNSFNFVNGNNGAASTKSSAPQPKPSKDVSLDEDDSEVPF